MGEYSNSVINMDLHTTLYANVPFNACLERRNHHLINTNKLNVSSGQECTNPGRRDAWATKLCTMVPNICASLVHNLLRVTLPAPRSFRCWDITKKNVGPCFRTTDIYRHQNISYIRNLTVWFYSIKIPPSETTQMALGTVTERSY
jgi:hypothetical protein